MSHSFPPYLPPEHDELEVSLFGPGFGESIVIHVGGGRWLIVDSCIDTRTGTPAGLNYLEAIGVPSDAVDLIVSTHWHDDHVRGLSQIVEHYSGAQFVCSLALQNAEFLSLASLYAELETKHSAGPKELKRVFDLLIQRKGSGGYRPIRWAQNATSIWAERLEIGGCSVLVEVTALSPSDEMVTRAVDEFARAYACASRSEQVTLIPSTRPNNVSVVLEIAAGGHSILLGSDLEENGNLLTGWSAILQSRLPRAHTSRIYKVAHHGSHTGHCDGVWDEMLEVNPIALLTPFRWGRHRLPNAIDRTRILERTDDAFITASPDGETKPNRLRSRKVEDLINRTTRKRMLAAGKMGHLRCRAPLLDVNARPQVSKFLGALDLAALSA